MEIILVIGIGLMILGIVALLATSFYNANYEQKNYEE